MILPWWILQLPSDDSVTCDIGHDLCLCVTFVLLVDAYNLGQLQGSTVTGLERIG